VVVVVCCLPPPLELLTLLLEKEVDAEDKPRTAVVPGMAAAFLYEEEEGG
jgi:hypothetical protein